MQIPCGALPAYRESTVVATTPVVDAQNATLLETEGWFYDWLTGGKTSAGQSVSEASALKVATVFACVRNISEDIAKLPLILYKRLKPRGKERATKLPLYSLLHDAPNDEMDSFTWRQFMTADALCGGQGYSEIVRNNAGEVEALNYIPRQQVIRAFYYEGMLKYEVLDPAGGTVIIDGGNMFNLKAFCGWSIIRLARETIGGAMAAEEHANSTFADAAVPSGVLEHPSTLKPEARANLIKTWEARHQNKRRIAVLEGGLKYNALSISNKDSEFLESRQFSVEEICRWFRVPPHKVMHLLRSTFCLPGDSLVFTERGPKPIQHVEKGEKVWSRSKDNHWVLSTVEKSAQTGVDKVLEITAGIRKLRCTANHRLPVRRRMLTPFTGGSGQCIIIDGERFRKTWEVVWVEAGKVKVGDQLLAANGFGGTGGTECPTRADCSEQFMESLGMLLGDGFYARTKKAGRSYETTFGLSHGENDSYLPHYVEAIENEFKACDGPYGMTNGGTVALKAKRRDKNTTVFYSSPAYAELKQIGIAGTAKTKRVPDWVFSVSDNLKLALIRGFLDADGTVKKNGQVNFVSVNKELLEGIRHLCISVGIRCGKVSESRIESNFSDKKREHLLFAFSCSNAKMNQRIGTHTDFYKERIANRIETKRRRNVKVYPFEAAQRTNPAGVIYTTVESVRVESVAVPVFDLNVEGTHTFVADGVLVHNSNIEEQNIEYVVDCLTSWGVRWEQEIRRKLIPKRQTELFAEILFEGLLRGDSSKRANLMKEKIYSGQLSPNDAREIDGMNPVEGGDEYFMPSTMATLDRIVNPPEPVAPQSPPQAPNEPDADENAAENAANRRKSLIAAHAEVLSGAVGRLLKVEAHHVEKHAGKPAGAAAIEKFYREHSPIINAALPSPIAAFGVSYWLAMAATMPDEIKRMIVEHGNTAPCRHLEQSRAEITNENAFERWTSGVRAEEFANAELSSLADRLDAMRDRYRPEYLRGDAA